METEAVVDANMAECDIEGGTLRYNTVYFLFYFYIIMSLSIISYYVARFRMLVCYVQVYNSKLSKI